MVCSLLERFSMRILLVDDDKDILAVVGQALREADAEIVTEDNAERALDRIKGEKFDWLITDGYMPDESGFDLAGEARLHQPEMKRVLVSGIYKEDAVALALFHKVFQKPVDTNELIAYLKGN